MKWSWIELEEASERARDWQWWQKSSKTKRTKKLRSMQVGERDGEMLFIQKKEKKSYTTSEHHTKFYTWPNVATEFTDRWETAIKHAKMLNCIYKSPHVSHIIHCCYFRCLSALCPFVTFTPSASNSLHSVRGIYTASCPKSEMKRTLRTRPVVWEYTRFFYSKCCTFRFIGSECRCPSHLTCNSICYYTHTTLNMHFAFGTDEPRSRNKNPSVLLPHSLLSPPLISTKNNFLKVFELLRNMFESSELHTKMFRNKMPNVFSLCENRDHISNSQMECYFPTMAQRYGLLKWHTIICDSFHQFDQP